MGGGETEWKGLHKSSEYLTIMVIRTAAINDKDDHWTESGRIALINQAEKKEEEL